MACITYFGDLFWDAGEGRTHALNVLDICSDMFGDPGREQIACTE